MKDTISKNTGNSRTLASVPNFLTLYPTYEAFARALINRELPIDIGPLNPAGVDTMGTALDKAALLKDATAALYGLGADAVPDDVLALPLSRCVFGSYVGTGKGGTNASPAKIFVGFHPRLFFVYKASGNLNYYEMNYPNTPSMGMVIDSPEIPKFWMGKASTDSYSLEVRFLDDGVTFAESSSYSASRTYQYANTTYRFIAIG